MNKSSMIFREQGQSVGRMTADWPLQARFLAEKTDNITRILSKVLTK